MATVNESAAGSEPEASLFDEEGFPWLENGERMDQKTFHERYLRTPEGFKAELIGGIVYVLASPVGKRHSRGDHYLSGWLYDYGTDTPGTEGQNNGTTILGEESEPQPDCALLILPEYGGQSRESDDEDGYIYGAPELVAETANSSRSLDLNQKLRDYERAGVREYIVSDLRKKVIHWFELREGRFERLARDEDGLFRSRVFPGLWLDPDALFGKDKRALRAALRRGLDTPEHAAFVAELERRREAGRPGA